MNRLSKEKKNQILMILAGTLGICALVWFFVIGAQTERLQAGQDGLRDLNNKIYRANLRIRRARTVETELSERGEQIAEQEARLIPVPELSGRKWLQDKLVGFIEGRYDVELTNLSNSALTGDEYLLLPKFPYSAAVYDVEVRAFFHEFGRFLADFENSFPLMRVQNLTIWPMATPSGAIGPTPDTPEDLLNSRDIERLGVRMRVVVLFKPPSS